MLGLASLIAECLGTTTRPRLEPAREGEVRHSLADIERMEAVLGFRPPVDLRTGLARACAWYRDHLPAAWRRRGG